MAASGFTPISLYFSTTASAVPTSGNLVAGELALNTLDEKLYFKNSAGTVKLLASNAASTGTVSSVAASVPAFLSVAGSPITTSGTLAITLSGTALPVANGGTGLTTTPANGALDIGNGTGFTRATLTAGTGVTITNGAGTISIAATGTGGTVTSVAVSGGTTGLTTSGGPITTSGTITLAGTLAIANGGTGQTTANAAFNALVPSQTSQSGKYLTTDGTNTSWGTNPLGTVTSVGQSFTGGLISVAGSPVTTSGTLALTVAGTSGGIPYFSSASTWATSAALAASSLVVGGGAGAAPATVTTGTGVVTALGVAVGTAGSFVVNGGVLGTPSSGTLTNCTFPTLNQNTTGTAANVTGIVAVLNGGTGASTAPNARTNLGATTVGGNFFTLTNPTAITFPRINADNTVSALDAATFRTAIGAGTGSGTVTGVTATSPVASSGGTAPVISLSAGYGDTLNPYASKTANFVLAAPNGAAGVPTFRAVVAADIPTLNQNTTGTAANVTGIVAVANGGTGLSSTPANGALDIGNGTGFTRATLTAGTGISITNASGAITIASTASGDNSLLWYFMG